MTEILWAKSAVFNRVFVIFLPLPFCIIYAILLSRGERNEEEKKRFMV